MYDMTNVAIWTCGIFVSLVALSIMILVYRQTQNLKNLRSRFFDWVDKKHPETKIGEI